MTSDGFNHKRNYRDVYDIDRPMTRHQRRTLEELIYSRISNPDEANRQLNQLESYNFVDAQEMIEDLLFDRMK